MTLFFSFARSSESLVFFTDLLYNMVQSVRPDGTDQEVVTSWNASTIKHITVYNSRLIFSTQGKTLGEVPLANLTAVRTVDTLRVRGHDKPYTTFRDKHIHIYDIHGDLY